LHGRGILVELKTTLQAHFGSSYIRQYVHDVDTVTIGSSKENREEKELHDVICISLTGPLPAYENNDTVLYTQLLNTVGNGVVFAADLQ
jgi:hypothetical protein